MFLIYGTLHPKQIQRAKPLTKEDTRSRGRVIPHRQITARPFQARDLKISFKIQLHPFPSREENNIIV